MQPGSDAGARLYDVLDAAFDGFMLLRAQRGRQRRHPRLRVRVRQPDRGEAEPGSRVEDIVGRGTREFAPRGVESGILDRCVDVLQSGEAWRREVPNADATQIWEVKISRADQDHVAVSYRDVTERVLQQERISRSEVQARQAAERMAALQAFTAALAAASTPAEVYAVIGSLVRPSAGGAGLVVLLRDEDRLTVHHDTGYEPAVIEQLRRAAADAQLPGHRGGRAPAGRGTCPRRTEFAAAQAGEAPSGAGRRPAGLGVPAAGHGRAGDRRARHRLPRTAASSTTPSGTR